jgi:DNA-binding response OmpR family regulator
MLTETCCCAQHIALAMPRSVVEAALHRICGLLGTPARLCAELSDLFKPAAAGAVAIAVYDGFGDVSLAQACARVRAARGASPFVLALSERADLGLEKTVLAAGADDFVGNASVQLARVLLRFEALVAAAKRRDLQRLTLGPIEVDLVTHQAQVAGVALRLTPVEFRMLVYLMHNAGRTVSIDELQHNAIRSHGTSLYEHMRRLLSKLGSARPLIRNVRGAGYVLSTCPC